MKKLQTFQLAKFVQNCRYDMLDARIVDQLKRHLLDTVASIIFSIDQPTVQKLFQQIQYIGENGKCNVPVAGNTAVDRAAQLFTVLIRYPDFMDNFLGKEATCHPSDNIGALLAAADAEHASGEDFLLAMALAYEIECRLVEEIPVMIRGFDHTILLAYSVTAALSKVFSLDENQLAHALSIAGNSFNPLVASRASYTYEWKGFASSMVAMGCTNSTLLAKHGITGPINIFEGPKGFKEVFNMELKYDWTKEDFSLIRQCILKRYNSEVHTQSTLEVAWELKQKHNFSPDEIENVDVTTFLTAYHIVGGGSYGDRSEVFSKEQADHSLPYVIAALLIDGDVYPNQFKPERIQQTDVQQLLKKVKVHTSSPLHKPLALAAITDPYTQAYPKKLFSKVEITMKNKQKIKLEKEDYHGFYTRPFDWNDVILKFRRLTSNIPVTEQDKIIEIVMKIEKKNMRELISSLVDLRPAKAASNKSGRVKEV